MAEVMKVTIDDTTTYFRERIQLKNNVEAVREQVRIAALGTEVLQGLLDEHNVTTDGPVRIVLMSDPVEWKVTKASALSL